MEQSAKQQLIERINTTNNILVTVSNNPTVDQLSAAIGLTLFLNKIGKHATAVFSGEVPNTLEFLKPENTIETNTNSLRDFIIALDKSKAEIIVATPRKIWNHQTKDSFNSLVFLCLETDRGYAAVKRAVLVKCETVIPQ